MSKEKIILVYDTETEGLPAKYSAPHTDTANWPRCVQIAWANYREDGTLINRESHLIHPGDVPFDIHPKALEVHKKTPEMLEAQGKPLSMVLASLVHDMWKADVIVAHNRKSFDEPIIMCEIHRVESHEASSGEWFDLNFQPHVIGYPPAYGEPTKQFCCTQMDLQKAYGKWPKLSELHYWFFKTEFENAHDAGGDVAACAACFFEAVKKGLIVLNK